MERGRGKKVRESKITTAAKIKRRFFNVRLTLALLMSCRELVRAGWHGCMVLCVICTKYLTDWSCSPEFLDLHTTLTLLQLRCINIVVPGNPHPVVHVQYRRVTLQPTNVNLPPYQSISHVLCPPNLAR